MNFKRLWIIGIAGWFLASINIVAAQDQNTSDQFRYGAPAIHSFDPRFFPGLVYNTSVIGVAKTTGHDEWQSWGFIEEVAPVLNLGIWNKGVDNKFKYSLRAVVINLEPAIKSKFIDVEERTTFSETDIGTLETIKFRYTLPQSRKNCLGFQLYPDDNSELYLRGYFCGHRDESVNKSVLVCIMDSFLANGAGEERPEPISECRDKTVFSR